MKTLLLALLLARPAVCEQPLEVRRGDLQVNVRVAGTVVPDDIIRLKSTIDGRVEELLVSTRSWAANGQPLGTLSNKEMAAILDSHSTTEKGILEERWRKIYRPTPIRCPKDCYVLRTFVKSRDWISPKTVIFEAAQELKAVGHVRHEDAQWIRDGQTVEFWDTNNPSKKLRGVVSHYVLDIQGQKFEPGGSFWIYLAPGRTLEPGTQWEGRIVPMAKKDVLLVPTDSLINYAGAIYLPVRVSTGITTTTLTEITAGIEAKRAILVLDDSRLKAAMKHHPEADPYEIERRVQEEYLKPEKKEKSPQNNLADPDKVYGEDPYAE